MHEPVVVLYVIARSESGIEKWKKVCHSTYPPSLPPSPNLVSSIDSSVKAPLSSSPPPGYVYAQQPQVVVMQQPVLGNPPGDQFVMSLFTVFCCFMPLGLIALIKSIEVISPVLPQALVIHTVKCKM